MFSDTGRIQGKREVSDTGMVQRKRELSDTGMFQRKRELSDTGMVHGRSMRYVIYNSVKCDNSVLLCIIHRGGNVSIQSRTTHGIGSNTILGTIKL